MIREFFEKHIWPWSVIHARELVLDLQAETIKTQRREIDDLRLDIAEISGFCAANMVSLRAIQTDTDRPIQIAYATGLAKAVIEPETEKKGAFAHITYITAEPVAYHIRESLDSLKLRNRFTRMSLKSDLRRAIANKIIDQSYDLVKSMVFDEEIPE